MFSSLFICLPVFATINTLFTNFLACLQNLDETSVTDSQDVASEDQDTTMDVLQDSDSQEEDTVFENSKGVIKNEFPQILNTLQQKDCRDKDGLVYTRKIVKIEKFWNESGGNNRPPPIVDKYIVGEDGKIKEIVEVEDEKGSESACIKVCSNVWRVAPLKTEFVLKVN